MRLPESARPSLAELQDRSSPSLAGIAHGNQVTLKEKENYSGADGSRNAAAPALLCPHTGADTCLV